MEIKNKCIVCELIVVGSFAWQFTLCSKCGGNIKDCVVDVKDTIEIKHSSSVNSQVAVSMVSGASHTMEIDKYLWHSLI